MAPPPPAGRIGHRSSGDPSAAAVMAAQRKRARAHIGSGDEPTSHMGASFFSGGEGHHQPSAFLSAAAADVAAAFVQQQAVGGRAAHYPVDGPSFLASPSSSFGSLGGGGSAPSLSRKGSSNLTPPATPLVITAQSNLAAAAASSSVSGTTHLAYVHPELQRFRASRMYQENFDPFMSTHATINLTDDTEVMTPGLTPLHRLELARLQPKATAAAGPLLPMMAGAAHHHAPSSVTTQGPFYGAPPPLPSNSHSSGRPQLPLPPYDASLGMGQQELPSTLPPPPYHAAPRSTTATGLPLPSAPHPLTGTHSHHHHQHHQHGPTPPPYSSLMAHGTPLTGGGPPPPGNAPLTTLLAPPLLRPSGDVHNKPHHAAAAGLPSDPAARIQQVSSLVIASSNGTGTPPPPAALQVTATVDDSATQRPTSNLLPDAELFESGRQHRTDAEILSSLRAQSDQCHARLQESVDAQQSHRAELQRLREQLTDVSQRYDRSTEDVQRFKIAAADCAKQLEAHSQSLARFRKASGTLQDTLSWLKQLTGPIAALSAFPVSPGLLSGAGAAFQPSLPLLLPREQDVSTAATALQVLLNEHAPVLKVTKDTIEFRDMHHHYAAAVVSDGASPPPATMASAAVVTSQVPLHACRVETATDPCPNIACEFAHRLRPASWYLLSVASLAMELLPRSYPCADFSLSLHTAAAESEDIASQEMASLGRPHLGDNDGVSKATNGMATGAEGPSVGWMTASSTPPHTVAAAASGALDSTRLKLAERARRVLLSLVRVVQATSWHMVPPIPLLRDAVTCFQSAPGSATRQAAGASMLQHFRALRKNTVPMTCLDLASIVTSSRSSTPDRVGRHFFHFISKTFGTDLANASRGAARPAAQNAPTINTAGGPLRPPSQIANGSGTAAADSLIVDGGATSMAVVGEEEEATADAASSMASSGGGGAAAAAGVAGGTSFAPRIANIIRTCFAALAKAPTDPILWRALIHAVLKDPVQGLSKRSTIVTWCEQLDVKGAWLPFFKVLVTLEQLNRTSDRCPTSGLVSNAALIHETLTIVHEVVKHYSDTAFTLLAAEGAHESLSTRAAEALPPDVLLALGFIDKCATEAAAGDDAETSAAVEHSDNDLTFLMSHTANQYAASYVLAIAAVGVARSCGRDPAITLLSPYTVDAFRKPPSTSRITSSLSEGPSTPAGGESGGIVTCLSPVAQLNLFLLHAAIIIEGDRLSRYTSLFEFPFTVMSPSFGRRAPIWRRAQAAGVAVTGGAHLLQSWMNYPTADQALFGKRGREGEPQTADSAAADRIAALTVVEAAEGWLAPVVVQLTQIVGAGECAVLLEHHRTALNVCRLHIIAATSWQLSDFLSGSARILHRLSGLHHQHHHHSRRGAAAAVAGNPPPPKAADHHHPLHHLSGVSMDEVAAVWLQYLELYSLSPSAHVSNVGDNNTQLAGGGGGGAAGVGGGGGSSAAAPPGVPPPFQSSGNLTITPFMRAIEDVRSKLHAASPRIALTAAASMVLLMAASNPRDPVKALRDARSTARTALYSFMGQHFRGTSVQSLAELSQAFARFFASNSTTTMTNTSSNGKIAQGFVTGADDGVLRLCAQLTVDQHVAAVLLIAIWQLDELRHNSALDLLSGLKDFLASTSHNWRRQRTPTPGTAVPPFCLSPTALSHSFTCFELHCVLTSVAINIGLVFAHIYDRLTVIAHPGVARGGPMPPTLASLVGSAAGSMATAAVNANPADVDGSSLNDARRAAACLTALDPIGCPLGSLVVSRGQEEVLAMLRNPGRLLHPSLWSDANITTVRRGVVRIAHELGLLHPHIAACAFQSGLLRSLASLAPSAGAHDGTSPPPSEPPAGLDPRILRRVHRPSAAGGETTTGVECRPLSGYLATSGFLVSGEFLP